MVGAHQNLNGSRDLTTPLLGMVWHPWASTYYRQNLPTIFEVPISTHCENVKGDTKYRKLRDLGVIRGLVWPITAPNHTIFR